jgi:predicted alpha/beta-fold hydrolase
LKLTTRYGFTGSRTSDFNLAVNHIREAFPEDIPMFGIGFSLGASILLKYLGTHTNIPLKAAVAVSPPWNFHKTTVVFPFWSSLISFALKSYFFRHSDMLSSSYNNFFSVMMANSPPPINSSRYDDWERQNVPQVNIISPHVIPPS